MHSCQSSRRSRLALVGLAALSLLCAAGCSEETGPRIIAVVPARAPSGASVDILGERFTGLQRTVAFGGHLASQLVSSDNRLSVRVPTGPSGLTIVVVQVDGRVSNAVDFYVDTKPADGGTD